jgi:hypothetical protein
VAYLSQKATFAEKVTTVFDNVVSSGILIAPSLGQEYDRLTIIAEDGCNDTIESRGGRGNSDQRLRWIAA